MMQEIWEFKVREVFNPDCDIAVHLLRLMAGYNDTITAYKYYLEEVKRNNKSKISETEQVYFFKLNCGHLYEAMLAFRDLMDLSAISDICKMMEKEGKEAYEQLKQDIGNVNGFFNTKLKILRDKMAVHYDKEEYGKKDKIGGFKNALSEFTKEGSCIIAGETYGETRFIVAGDVMINIVKKEVEDCGRVSEYTNYLQRFVCHFFKSYLKYFKLSDKVKIENYKCTHSLSS
ncbi:MAG: hypothetical protein A2W23_03055 [Planctomycetes bacterium RBG_16_43_13]|nr:MAG: hypothetical protein A2W23_03055 [Planctomycetes bacterium RBG_16_43_13]